MIFQFDCIFYYVSDLARSVAFYRDALGFTLISQDAVARFDVGGVLLELVPSTHTGSASQHGNGRLCLRVQDVRRVLQELRSKGVRVAPAQGKDGGTLGCFQDPDGNEICLWEYTHESE